MFNYINYILNNIVVDKNTMGRFDVLKENTFQSSKKNKRQKRANTKPSADINSKPSADNNINSKPSADNNIKPSADNNINSKPSADNNIKPSADNQQSVWIKKIKSQEDTEKDKINEKDPKYWKGPIWCGPMFIKAKEKQSEKWKSYIKNACEKKTNTILLPKYTLLYSRNNKHWFPSFEESFSQKQLENMKMYEKEKYNESCANILEKFRIANIKESNEYYNLTGELDNFARAHYEREKYEKYCEQFEIEEYEDEEYESDSYLEEEEEENEYYN